MDLQEGFLIKDFAEGDLADRELEMDPSHTVTATTTGIYQGESDKLPAIYNLSILNSVNLHFKA